VRFGSIVAALLKRILPLILLPVIFKH